MLEIFFINKNTSFLLLQFINKVTKKQLKVKNIISKNVFFNKLEEKNIFHNVIEEE